MYVTYVVFENIANRLWKFLYLRIDGLVEFWEQVACLWGVCKICACSVLTMGCCLVKNSLGVV